MLNESFGAPLLFSFGIVLFCIFGALGGYLLAEARQFNALGAASQDWASTSGRIITADYKTRLTRRRTVATIDVRYTFDVDGRSYSGSTLAFEKLSSLSVPEAQRRLQPYPEGAACTVFYDAENPERNVLETGVRSSNTGSMLVAMLFLVAALFGLYDGVAGGINALRFPDTQRG